MRIEGYVPVKGGQAAWRYCEKTVDAAIRELCGSSPQESGTWNEWKKAGWKIVRIGDVDSIRDEALEEVAEWHDNEAAKLDGHGGQGEVIALVHLAAADDIRFMKAKP